MSPFAQNFWSSPRGKMYAGMALVAILAYLVHSVLQHHMMHSFEIQMTSFQTEMQKKDQHADALQKRIDTLNEFLEQVKVHQVIETNRKQKDQMAQLQKQLVASSARLKAQKEQNKDLQHELQKIKQQWQDEIQVLKMQMKQKLTVKDRALEQQHDLLQKMKAQAVVVLHDGLYTFQEHDLTSLVLQVQFLKYLCQNYSRDLEVQKILYEHIMRQLKAVFPDDKYIQDLKALPVHSKSSWLLGLRRKYIDGQPQVQNEPSLSLSQRMVEQMGYVLEYMDMTYLTHP